MRMRRKRNLKIVALTLFRLAASRGPFLYNSYLARIGGTIRVKAGPDRGSDFMVEIPVRPKKLSASVSVVSIQNKWRSTLSRRRTGAMAAVTKDIRTHRGNSEKKL